MQIFDKPDSRIPACERGVGLGFFDGVHRGHLELLRTLVFRSKKLSLLPAIFTFPAHPESILNPDALFTSYLGDLTARMALVEDAGIREAHLQPFDKSFADMEPETFLDEILDRRLKARLVVVGPDYRFGRGGRGDAGLLEAWAREHGVEVIIVPQVAMFGGKISSSRIRNAVCDGDLSLAASLLGRPYRLSGQVGTGRGLGHRLGFPTANIRVPADLTCPSFGVYVTRTVVRGQAWNSVSNIGLRPTVEESNALPVIETHLLDADLDLYGQDIDIDFLAYIRPEERFSSLEDLKAQVRADVDTSRQWHARHEQGYELARPNGIPLYFLPTGRFAQAALHVVFYMAHDARSLACMTLLMRVLTASCRRCPTRTELAATLDRLYGSSIEAGLDKQGDLLQIDLEAEGLVSWTDGSSPFSEVCGLLFDVLFDPLLDQDGLFDADMVGAERRSLLLEMASRENDRAKYAYDRLLAALCGDQVQGLPPGGGAGFVKAVTRQDLAKAYQDLLDHTEVTVFLGGAVDNTVIDACSAGIRRFPQGDRPVRRPGELPSPFTPAPFSPVTEKMKVEQARIALAYTGLPPYYSHRAVLATILNSMLGGDVHSLLFDVVREKLGLAYSVFSSHLRCLEALIAMAGVAPGQSDKALEAMRQQVDNLAAGRFEASLFERSMKMIESALRASGDELSVMMARLINSKLYGRDMNLAESLSLLGDATQSDIISLAGQLRLSAIYILTAEDPA